MTSIIFLYNMDIYEIYFAFSFACSYKWAYMLDLSSLFLDICSCLWHNISLCRVRLIMLKSQIRGLYDEYTWHFWFLFLIPEWVSQFESCDVTNELSRSSSDRVEVSTWTHRVYTYTASYWRCLDTLHLNDGECARVYANNPAVRW